MPTSRRTLLSLAATAPLLAACGTSEPAVAPSGPTSSAAAGPVTVTDGRGKTVTLAAPASRVVTLEWGPTEDVLSLGVQPTGVADPKGFGSWVSSQSLLGTPVDVGMRTEPSLESIGKASPDLILGISGSIPEAAVAQAEKIAPVVLLKGADATRPLALMRDNYNAVATLVGKTAEAQKVLAAYDAKLTEAKQKLSGRTAPFAFAYINVTGATAELRMHGPRSVPGAVAKEIGLVNAWNESGDDGWGIGSLDLEGLTKLPADTTVLSWANSTMADPVSKLAGNGVWSSLPFVKAGRVKPVADKVWVYGGPSSLMQWADQLVAALA